MQNSTKIRVIVALMLVLALATLSGLGGKVMKIAVTGGSGLIGNKLVHQLTKLDHQVVVASPSTGVNTIIGEELAQALVGAPVVVDVANAPFFRKGGDLGRL